jgi:DNA-binding response OmpR family regulator
MASVSRSRRRATPQLRVGVMDTDAALRDAVDRRFKAHGWHVQQLHAPVPHAALVPLRLHALVFDLEPLGRHGWDYLDRLAKELPDLGIVVCTRRSTVAQRVRGLGLGVDDWVTKPLDPAELAARVEAVVRRRLRDEPAADETIRAGGLELRVGELQAFVDGVSVKLTPREFELLLLLVRADGQVMPREEIYQRLWGYAMVGGDRSVDVFVGKVRHKLKAVSPDRNYVHTTFGVGYRFAAEISRATRR